MIFSIGTPNARSEAITICRFTVSSVPGGSEFSSSSVRETRSCSSAVTPPPPHTLPTAPPPARPRRPRDALVLLRRAPRGLVPTPEVDFPRGRRRRLGGEHRQIVRLRLRRL